MWQAKEDYCFCECRQLDLREMRLSNGIATIDYMYVSWMITRQMLAGIDGRESWLPLSGKRLKFSIRMNQGVCKKKLGSRSF